MDNHSSKTTNNYPPDGHLSYKKKAPIVIDAAKVREVGIGDATFTSETYCRSSVFFIADA